MESIFLCIEAIYCTNSRKNSPLSCSSSHSGSLCCASGRSIAGVCRGFPREREKSTRSQERSTRETAINSDSLSLSLSPTLLSCARAPRLSALSRKAEATIPNATASGRIGICALSLLASSSCRLSIFLRSRLGVSRFLPPALSDVHR